MRHTVNVEPCITVALSNHTPANVHTDSLERRKQRACPLRECMASRHFAHILPQLSQNFLILANRFSAASAATNVTNRRSKSCSNSSSVAFGGSSSANITEPPATTNPSHQPVFQPMSLPPSNLFDLDLGWDLSLPPSPVPSPTRPPAENAHPRPTATRPPPAKRVKREVELKSLKVVDSIVKQRELTNLRFWPPFPREVVVGNSFVAAVATNHARMRGSASVPHVEGQRVKVQVMHVDSDSANDGLA